MTNSLGVGALLVGWRKRKWKSRAPFGVQVNKPGPYRG